MNNYNNYNFVPTVRCKYGYYCNKKLNCTFKHTFDEIKQFKKEIPCSKEFYCDKKFDCDYMHTKSHRDWWVQCIQIKRKKDNKIVIDLINDK